MPPLILLDNREDITTVCNMATLTSEMPLTGDVFRCLLAGVNPMRQSSTSSASTAGDNCVDHRQIRVMFPVGEKDRQVPVIQRTIQIPVVHDATPTTPGTSRSVERLQPGSSHRSFCITSNKPPNTPPWPTPTGYPETNSSHSLACSFGTSDHCF